MDYLFSNKARGFFCTMAVVLSGMLLVGCEELIDPVSTTQYGDSDNPLVLPSGWAWTNCGDYVYSCMGVIFTADGRIIDVNRYYGEWEKSGSIGTYTIAGNRVTITYPGSDNRNGTWEIRFSPDGQTLTATPGSDVRYSGTMVITKTSGVNVVIPPANPGTGGNLVLGSDKAWRFNDWTTEGYQFLSDGTVNFIMQSSGRWTIEATGTYTISGGNVSIYWNSGYYATWSYSVSGNTLTIYDEYDTYTLSVVSGVTFSTDPPDVTPGTGGNLVLGSGQAWRYNDWPTEGYQFLSNGTVYDTWYTSGSWVIENTGTYTTNNGIVTIYWNGGYTEAWSYSVSGNTLTIYDYGEAYTLSIVSDVNFSTPAGGNLVLSSNQAWIWDDDGGLGMIFQSSGNFSMIEYYMGSWEVFIAGTYTTNGGNITLDIYGDTEYGTYTVSGNTLYMTIGGETNVFTKTSGITVAPPTAGSLVLPYGQAWTYYGGENYSWDFGLIFDSDGYVKYILKESGDWYILDEGWYETNENRITVYWYSDYGTENLWYSVSGNTLTLDGERYIKTSDVYPYQYYYAPSKSLGKRPKAGYLKKPKLFRQKTGTSASNASLSKSRVGKPIPKTSVKPEPKRKPGPGVKGSEFLAKK